MMKRGTPYQPMGGGHTSQGRATSLRTWVMRAITLSTLLLGAWMVLRPPKPGFRADPPPAEDAGAAVALATDRAGPPGEPAQAAPVRGAPAAAHPEPAAAAAASTDGDHEGRADDGISHIGSTDLDWMHYNSWPETAEAMNNLTYEEWEAVSWKPRLLSHIQPRGDYVSFGKLRPWFEGDVFPREALKAALQARSYERELIVFCFNAATVEEAVQLGFNLRDNGWDHWLALTDVPGNCDVIRAAFPNGACGWSSLAEALPGARARPKDGVEFKQLFLWATVARAVRLRYNVLTIDVDMAFHYDVYAFLKAPPYANMTLMWQNDGYPKINSGAVYIQNAAPNGLAAWAATEEVLRPLRYIDSPRWHLDQPAFGDKFEGRLGDFLDQVSWEQDLWTASMESAMLGMPWLGDAAWPGRQWPARKNRPRGQDWALSHEWQARLNSSTAWYWSFEAAVPAPSAADVEAAGGPVYPPESGTGLVAKFKKLLEEESGPLWAEPYEPLWRAGGGQRGGLVPAAPAKKERAGMLMDFLFDSFDGFRKARWWRLSPPRCVVCHAVSANGGKQMRLPMWKSLGWWRWRGDHIVRSALQLPGVYASSSARHPVPPLLVLAPGTVNLTVQSEADWQRLNIHFASLAHLLGRVPVMPLISCRSPFLGSEGHSWFHNITWDYNRHGVLPVDDELYPESSEMCYAWVYGKDHCNLRLAFHWDYLRQVELLRQRPAPEPHNTALHAARVGGRLAGRPFGLEPLTLAAARRLAAAFPVDEVPVLYLGVPVRLTQVDPGTLRALTDFDYWQDGGAPAYPLAVCTSLLSGVDGKQEYRRLFLQED